MSTTIERETGNVYVIKVSGRLVKADMERFQGIAKAEIRKIAKIKMLIITENFSGWERGVEWGDVSFMIEHDADIEKIAIVGEEKWRSEMLMFLGAGLRSAPVEFFTLTEVEMARAWLNSEEASH
ncbi:MAG: STAS/SEC14 domain-containing protein [Pseudomonadota bacterium]